MLIDKINLQLFAEMNTQTTASADLSVEMKTYYSDYLIDLVQPKLVHDQFAQTHDIPKNGGKTVEFRKFEPLGKLLTPLVEGVTPDGQSLQVSKIEATVEQYGGYVTLADMYMLTAIDNNLLWATKLIADQAGATLDTITREILVGGTNVYYAGGVTARNAVKDVLTVDDIRKARRALKAQNAPTIDGYYVAIVHPDVVYDITSDPKWEAVKQYDPADWYEGEIGRIDGVRFVESTEAKVIEDAGANGKSVYCTMLLGRDAYGTTKVSGGGLEHITKPLGSAGTSDPLNQRATVGWKATKTAVRLVEQYMIRIESASTFDSLSN